MVHTKSTWLRKIFALVFCVSVFAFTVLGKEAIRVYTIPKEHPPVAQAAADNSIPTTDASASPIHWTTPSAWKELPPTNVRIGNFVVNSGDKKAEVTITSFPGDVGGELSNINRWRRELTLGAITEKEISSAKTIVGSSEAKLYDFSGDTARTIVAWLQREGNSWFFKLKGDKSVVADAEKTFLEFLKSIHFGAAAALPVTEAKDNGADPHGNSAQLPAGHPDVSGEAKTAETKDSAAEPSWTVPSNWKEKPPGMMVLKSFSVESSAGQAAIAISSFPGEVGGKLANVNRWRGQMGLPKIEAADLDKETQSIDVLGGKATLVDVKGTDAKSGKAARLVAVMVPHEQETWFYKLLGDDAIVGAEKENFVKFVQTVRY